MDQITLYTTFLKEILDAKPWIWHVIQAFLLFVFLGKVTLLFGNIKKSKIFKIVSEIDDLLILSVLFVYNKMLLWGIIMYVILNFIDLIINQIRYKSKLKLISIWKVIRAIIITTTIFSISNEFGLKYKIVLLLIWFIYIQQVYLISSNSYKYCNKFKLSHLGKTGDLMIFFEPKFIALIMLPFSWYIWIIVFLLLFEPEISNESYPEFYLKNEYTLIDNWKGNSSKNKLFFLISILILFYLNFNVNSFLLLGLIKFILNKYPPKRGLFSSPLADYNSFTTITGNFNYLFSIVTSNKLLLLVQRISIKLSDNFSYGILVSPHENVIIKHNEIINLQELRPNSHHLILLDGGENSDKILKIENDFNSFLGRVDTVIDYFTIAEQPIDRYSEPIKSNYAKCIRERITLKQTVIDEKPFELTELPDKQAETIDVFINSINTESVRLNMLVRDYFNESKLDYNSLQTELINNGTFEINTLLRQMREGGSIPSRFVDALSIAEVAARYLFSIVNEVNIYLDNTENGIQERNVKYSQLSFGPCVGFLRTITEKGRLNDFEKSIKEILKTKYTDNVNSDRLKKYLTKDLHYDKEVKEEPTLFDLFNYLAYIRNKTRGHGTPSKVEFEFYVTLDLISIFIVHCISKIQIETYTRQIINDQEWLLYYNSGGNVVLHPLNPKVNLDYWRDSFDWNYLDKMEDAKKQLEAVNQAVYFKIIYKGEVVWIKAETYFKCKEGIIYMYDGINKDEAEWISFTTGAVIRPYRIN